MVITQINNISFLLCTSFYNVHRSSNPRTTNNNFDKKKKSRQLPKRDTLCIICSTSFNFFVSLYLYVYPYALEFNRDVIDLYGDFDKPEDFGDSLDLGDDVEDGFFLLFLLLVWILDRANGLGGTSLSLSDTDSWLELWSKSVFKQI